jgi:hypothetical protein
MCGVPSSSFCLFDLLFSVLLFVNLSLCAFPFPIVCQPLSICFSVCYCLSTSLSAYIGQLMQMVLSDNHLLDCLLVLLRPISRF